MFLTGDGDAFSAGLNLKEVAALDERGMARFLETLERMVTALYEYPGPVVAWVNGHAIAGGCVVALACDHRLMTSAPRARIGLNEVPLGLRFPPRTWRLVRHQAVASHRRASGCSRERSMRRTPRSVSGWSTRSSQMTRRLGRTRRSWQAHR